MLVIEVSVELVSMLIPSKSMSEQLPNSTSVFIPSNAQLGSKLVAKIECCELKEMVIGTFLKDLVFSCYSSEVTIGSSCSILLCLLHSSCLSRNGVSFTHLSVWTETCNSHLSSLTWCFAPSIFAMSFAMSELYLAQSSPLRSNHIMHEEHYPNPRCFRSSKYSFRVAWLNSKNNST